jgi:Na+/proline symporter
MLIVLCARDYIHCVFIIFIVIVIYILTILQEQQLSNITRLPRQMVSAVLYANDIQEKNHMSTTLSSRL